MSFDYDLIVIGAGPAGYCGAIKAAQLGLKTALIEKENIGGTCLNKGCIPTKSLLHSATLYKKLKSASLCGINAENISYDINVFYDKKNAVVDQISGGIKALIKANKIDYINSTAKIIDKNTVALSEKNITGKYILIACGSEIIKPNIEGIDLDGVLNSDTLLKTASEFNSIVIIGGGVIGIEFSDIFSSLGKKVTIIEASERILPMFEKEISLSVATSLKKRGVEIYTSSFVKKIEKKEQLVCFYEKNSSVFEISSEKILYSVGRKAAYKDLFYEKDLLKHEKGITVDEFGRTSIDNIYAAGDVTNNSIQLAHFASAAAINAVCHMANIKNDTNLSLVPSCLYTTPEIASVGIDVDTAKKMNIDTVVAKFPMLANPRAVIEKSERGYIKVICNKETNKIIGAQIISDRATDMISEFALAIANEMTASDFIKAIRPHPSFSESALEAAESIFGSSIHTFPR